VDRRDDKEAAWLQSSMMITDLAAAASVRSPHHCR